MTNYTGGVGEKMSFQEKVDGLSERAKHWLQKACSALDEGVGYENHAPSRTECRVAGLITQKPFGRIEISGEVIQAMLRRGGDDSANVS